MRAVAWEAGIDVGLKVLVMVFWLNIMYAVLWQITYSMQLMELTMTCK